MEFDITTFTAGNDTRGWILTCLSGVACFFGAGVICIDYLICRLPGHKDFKIQNSDAFLSCSLSLSSGVMLFSALYSMLPSSKQYLQDGGLSSRAAAWVLILSFLAGVFGIMLLSRIIHRFIPSHAVDCHHTHDEDRHNEHKHTSNGAATQSETTPLLSRPDSISGDFQTPEVAERVDHDHTLNKRPSLQKKMTEVVTDIVAGRKTACDTNGPCFGYSDPCGRDCFKNLQARNGRTPATSLFRYQTTQHLRIQDEESAITEFATQSSRTSQPLSAKSSAPDISQQHHHRPASSSHRSTTDAHDHPNPHAAASQGHHHHHVPKNAFLSISLQTSIAIALHKLPEGFITYATNHANPRLGFAVFVALFIHNLTEGFALALPIYLATASRPRALALSFVLGGLSQPLGAGVAAAWLAIAEKRRGEGSVDGAIGEAIYGGMFAVTAGIMASVALSLFREGLERSHNRGACMCFAFVGMGVLGISTALTA